MLVVQMWSGDRGDEELGTVGVWAGVGHGEETGVGVFEGEVLVGEAAAPTAEDVDFACAVAVGDVAALAHEAGDLGTW